VRFTATLIVAAAALACATVAGAARPLQTAVYIQPSDLKVSDPGLVFQRVRNAGATAVRLIVKWKDVAPDSPPAGFDPSNPADPAYNWKSTDRQIQLAVGKGLVPLVTVVFAPKWAEGGASRGDGNRLVDPTALGQFARAIATRYGGSFQGLPRVRYWLAWNEPNITKYLAPQVQSKHLVGPARYRNLVNAFAASVHGVHKDNVVVAGLLSPFTFKNDPGPLRFMRALLCMSSGSRPKPTCNSRIHFDIWSAHPYTSGGPTHHAFSPDDVSIGDLPRMNRLLRAAVNAHHVIARGGVRFWVTEFSWDSRPPDSAGVPLQLEAQWVAEGLYRMWKAGVSLVTWFQLRDEARPSPFQSGLYFRGTSLASSRPKPAMTAFRFPFVAFRQSGGVLLWGRTPTGNPGTVGIELSTKHGWKKVGKLQANRLGIFSKVLRIRVSSTASMRANFATPVTVRSFPFPLKPPPDRFVQPFGR
jgi:hypothetical protein